MYYSASTDRLDLLRDADYFCREIDRRLKRLCELDDDKRWLRVAGLASRVRRVVRAQARAELMERRS